MRSCDSRSSRMSVSSQRSSCSRLSQRSCSRQRLSTEEIEELRVAAKRGEVKALMAENKRRGRKAIHCPESIVRRRSLSLTVPKEFNLSCPNTPSRSIISNADSEYSDGGDSNWSCSLRRSVPHSPSRAWGPKLTVPSGPSLRTSSRARSTSRDRGSSGTSSRSMSRHGLPREQAAIERHFDRLTTAEAQKEVSDSAPIKTAQATTQQDSLDELDKNSSQIDLDEWVKAASSAQERAQRARKVAELKHKKKSDEKDAKVKVFVGAKASTVVGAQLKARSGHFAGGRSDLAQQQPSGENIQDKIGEDIKDETNTL